MQKEVSDSVTMCSLDSAWQSALRQRLRRRSSRFFRAKTRESTSVPHPNVRRTSECAYTSRYWGDSSSHNPLLPVFPPLTQAPPRLQSHAGQMLKAKGWVFLQGKLFSASPTRCCPSALFCCRLGWHPACSHTRQQHHIWSKTRGDTPKT